MLGSVLNGLTLRVRLTRLGLERSVGCVFDGGREEGDCGGLDGAGDNDGSVFVSLSVAFVVVADFSLLVLVSATSCADCLAWSLLL